MSGALLNIPSYVKDPYYRYKMPKLLTKIEGKGNGIKTVVPNMADIAKALNRPPSHPTKFFGFEVGSLTVIDDENSKYVVNGAHDAEKFQKILDNFIERYVLCGRCRNPETDLVFEANEVVNRDCKACGQKTVLDPVHRLTTFILKQEKFSSAAGKKANKKERRNKKAGDAGSDNENEGESMSASMEKLNVQEGGVKEVIPNTAVVPEAEQHEFQEFVDYLSNKEQQKTDLEIFEKSKALQVPSHKAVALIFEFLFSPSEDSESAEAVEAEPFLLGISERATLLKKFIKGHKEQKAILGGMERLLGLRVPGLVDETWKVLKILYDMDIVDEDVMLEWSRKISRKYVEKEVCKLVHYKAKPFIKWLEEAEEESEEESD